MQVSTWANLLGMRKLEHALDFHVFVCQNERPAGHPRGCCKERGSEALLQALKSEAARQGKTTRARIQKSGCLDVCENGPSLVIYSPADPQGRWLGEVSLDDVQEIVSSLATAPARTPTRT